MNKLNFMQALKLMYFGVLLGSMTLALASAQYGGGGGTGAAIPVSSTVCSIVNTVRAFIGFISLLLFIIGGTLYAIAHFLPAAGNMRGNLQGWSIGMIIGGIVGIILVLAAPAIVNLVIGAGGSGVVSTVSC